MVDQFVLTYLGLRRAVGFIGLLLPAVLLLGKQLLQGGDLPGSISAYYYTEMRNVLVGSLCAIGVFLISYRPTTVDDVISTLAGVFAIGVALFPTAASGHPDPAAFRIAVVHTICATSLFLTLAAISYFRFPKPDPGTQLSDPAKKRRNVLYRTCGLIIAACVLVAVLDVLIGDARTTPSTRLFWLESAAVMAFGLAWLVKGHFLRGNLRKSTDKTPVARTTAA
jgi:hypothetical protein